MKVKNIRVVDCLTLRQEEIAVLKSGTSNKYRFPDLSGGHLIKTQAPSSKNLFGKLISTDESNDIYNFILTFSTELSKNK